MHTVTIRVTVEGWSQRLNFILNEPASVAALHAAIEVRAGKTVGHQLVRELRRLLGDVLGAEEEVAKADLAAATHRKNAIAKAMIEADK